MERIGVNVGDAAKKKGAKPEPGVALFFSGRLFRTIEYLNVVA